MRGLLLLILMALSLNGVASDTTIIVGGWSYHYDRSKTYNESHSLIGVEHKNFSFKTFENSHWRRSYGIGYKSMEAYNDWIEMGGYFALWSGYEGKLHFNSDIVPVIAFRTDIKVTEHLKVATFVSPVVSFIVVGISF